MIGVVLAAGFGSRLRPITDTVPKTLVPIGNDLTILDVILRNFSVVGLGQAAIVVGYAAEAIEGRLPQLKERYALDITLIHNDRHDWNNAYSLWLARDHYAQGALLANGDTLHPHTVPQELLAKRGPELLLTVDSRKVVTEESMKVRLDPAGRITQITKGMPLSESYGEYIGTSLIVPEIAAELTSALEATWKGNPNLYYEDGYQLFADRGGVILPSDPGAIEWVEVDDHADLARAQEISCRY